MCEEETNVWSIEGLIRADEEDNYLKDYNRIKSGKKFDIDFIDYKKYYINTMIEYFESIGDYVKSGYLNLRLNGFK